MPYRIAYLAGFTKPPTPPKPAVLEWGELVKLLGHVVETPCGPSCVGKDCPDKKGPAWIPADLVDNPLSHLDRNIRSVTVAVFDVDHLPDDELLPLAQKLEPYTYIIHSTHTHRQDGLNSLRVVIPLSEPVPAAEWVDFFRAAVDYLCIPADPVCRNAARLFFLNRVPVGADRMFETNDAAPLDVNLVRSHKVQVSLAIVPPRTPALTVPIDTRPDPVDVFNLDEVRKAVHYAQRRKANRSRRTDLDDKERARAKDAAEMLRRILAGEPIAVPGNFQGQTDLPRGRDDTLHRAMGAIAFAVPPLTPFATVMEIIRPTVTSMAEPEGVVFWMSEAADMYKRGCQKRAAVEADNEKLLRSMQDLAASLYGRRDEYLAASEPSDEDKAGHDDDAGAAHGAGSAAPEWQAYLRPNPNGKGWEPSGHNVKVILLHDPAVAGFLRWNEVRRKPEVTGGRFVNVPEGCLDVEITDWLCAQWGIRVAVHDVRARIMTTARANPYDPIRDYLIGLTWDRKERLDNWLIVYAGAKTRNDDGEDITDLVRLFGARFLIAMVARGIHPGTQVDTVLVLEGKTGGGKTTLCRTLAGEFFTGGKMTIGDKDARLAVQRSWLIEFGEMASMKRADTDTMKQFLTEVIDSFRPPYGAVVEDFPRRSCFIGTVNPNDEVGGAYLTDPTGNRRYWPVTVADEIDKEALARDRDQLFAEAVERYVAFRTLAAEGVSPKDPRMSPLRWWFEPGEQDDVERRVTQDRLLDDPSPAEAIRAWWTKLQHKPNRVTLHFVIENCFPRSLGVDPRQQGWIGRALIKAGFHKVPDGRGPDGKKQWVYEPLNVKPLGHAPRALSMVP